MNLFPFLVFGNGPNMSKHTLSRGAPYREWIDENGINNKMQMLVPESLKEDILKLYHDVPTAGHLGVDKYLEKIKPYPFKGCPHYIFPVVLYL
jgi:hypothetical protein